MVVAVGMDSCYGNYVVVRYSDVGGYGDIMANYFHLVGTSVKKGARTTKDTKLSSLAADGFQKSLSAGWVNPLAVMHCKPVGPTIRLTPQ